MQPIPQPIGSLDHLAQAPHRIVAREPPRSPHSAFRTTFRTFPGVEPSPKCGRVRTASLHPGLGKGEVPPSSRRSFAIVLSLLSDRSPVQVARPDPNQPLTAKSVVT